MATFYRSDSAHLHWFFSRSYLAHAVLGSPPLAPRNQHLLPAFLALERPAIDGLLPQAKAGRGISTRLSGPGSDGPEALGRGAGMVERSWIASRNGWRGAVAQKARGLLAVRGEASEERRACQ